MDIAHAQIATDEPILDVGCGGGWLLAALAGNQVAESRLHGVDLIGSRVRAASERLPDAEIQSADARSLPFPDRRFGLVTLLTTLSSVPGDLASVRRALAETRRVCGPRGLILVFEPRISNPFNRSTRRVPASLLAAELGPAVSSTRLTGFPPLARRLGPLTGALYRPLASVLPTHRISAHAPH